jgi:ribA/ribD-fused uncharacterized protein
MTIIRFVGPFGWLSNFSPATVTLDGENYSTVEHAFQAAKTLDHMQRRRIREARSPARARTIGRKVPLRSDWPSVRLSIMTDLLRQKFAVDTALAALLLATGDRELVEGNTWGDHFWGVSRGIGENHLGRLLMARRDELRASP